MAVLLETSRGDIVIDLFVDECPITCKNFLKLCKLKYYNNNLFYNVQRNFIAQTGDPTGTGKGGSSVYGLLYGDQARFFEDELRPMLRHRAKGMVGMASPIPNANASQFYITSGEELDSLDGKHTIFGQVAEGLDVLDKINEAFVDDDGRPLQNIRIRHTIVLEDPFDDPAELEPLIPPTSPEPQFEQGNRLEDDWVPPEDTRDADAIEEETRKAEAHNRAVVLEMIGDLPEADVKPPANVLFICKLNPVTTEEDLEIIFSRFGNVVDCSIIRDFKTGDSLCYGFIGFDSEASCEEAYFKMNNVLIDDRRIKVDFSQSVSHLWKQFKKGGGKGDAAMMKEADQHERQGPGAGRLQAKPGGMFGGRGGGGGPGSHHTLMLDDDPPPASMPPQQPARQVAERQAAGPRHPDRQPPPRHDARPGDGHRGDVQRREDRGRHWDGGNGGRAGGEAGGGRDHSHRNGRDGRGEDRQYKSRERSRDRDRPRSRSRDRRRSRSRDRGRERAPDNSKVEHVKVRDDRSGSVRGGRSRSRERQRSRERVRDRSGDRSRGHHHRDRDRR